MSKEDTHLVKQVLAGKRAAMQVLYDRYERKWFRLCLRYGTDRAEAQDMLQEGLIQVFKDLKQFDPAKGAFEYWARRVMVHAALRYLKKNQWQHSFLDLDADSAYESSDQDAIGTLSAKELTRLIQQLPTGYRIVFNMYEIEGYAHREIAQALEISVGTSKSQLSKAKRMLRLKLEALFE